MNLFLCYDGCSTCKKARAWLEQQGAAYQARPIREQNPTADELAGWTARSGLPRNKFVNTSGQLYRQMGLKDKLPALSDEEFFCAAGHRRHAGEAADSGHRKRGLPRLQARNLANFAGLTGVFS